MQLNCCVRNRKIFLFCQLWWWSSAAAVFASAATEATADSKTDSDIAHDVHEYFYVNPNADPARIVVGSCHSQLFDSTQMWEMIHGRRPTAFIWGGDSVYGDDQPPRSNPPPPSADTDNVDPIKPQIIKAVTKNKNNRGGWRREGTPFHMKELYTALRNHPTYSKLVGGGGGEKDDDNGCHIFGTLDDHDYGTNNGDSTFRYKYDNGIEFLRFLGMLDGHPGNENELEGRHGQKQKQLPVMARRALEGKGVYGVQVYDFSHSKRSERVLTDEEAGIDPDVFVGDETTIPSDSSRGSSNDNTNASSDVKDNNRLVAVFVLDIRTNKSPWPKRLFHRDVDGDFLGDEQWAWFETALQRSNAAVNIIVSGIQVHPAYMNNQVENWAAFPTSQHRLYQTILKSGASSPILISGDVHMSQLMKKDCRRRKQQERRSLYEITTSGITHSWGSRDRSICGTPSKSKLCYFYPFNLWMGIIAHLAHYLIPLKSIILFHEDPSTESRTATANSSSSADTGAITKTSLQYTLQRNVAELDFDFDKRMVIVRILSDTGTTLLKQDWSFDALNGRGDEGKKKEDNDGSIFSSSSVLLDEERYERSKRIVLRHQGTTIDQEKKRSSTSFPTDSSVSNFYTDDDFVCVSHRGEPTLLHFVLATASAVTIMFLGLFSPFILLVALGLYYLKMKKPEKTSATTGDKVRSGTSNKSKRE